MRALLTGTLLAAFVAISAAPAHAAGPSVVYSDERLTGIDFPVGPLGHGASSTSATEPATSRGSSTSRAS